MQIDTEEVAGSNPVVPTILRFRDIQDNPIDLLKPLKMKLFLYFCVQWRIVEAKSCRG
jgi:hypothetical protein